MVWELDIATPYVSLDPPSIYFESYIMVAVFLKYLHVFFFPIWILKVLLADFLFIYLNNLLIP